MTPCDHPKDKISTYTAGDPFEECRVCGAWRPLGAPAWGNKPTSAWHMIETPFQMIHRLQNKIVMLCAETDKLQRENDRLRGALEEYVSSHSRIAKNRACKCPYCVRARTVLQEKL